MMSPKPSNKPEQYKKGWVEFYKLKFKVTPDVLIPRPETELLVDEVLRVIATLSQSKGKQSLVLDIGTGSGCIAISIAKNSSNTKIVATDVSEKALKVAAQNASLHGVNDKIEFLESNLLSHPELYARPVGVDSGSILIDSDFRQNDNLIIVTNLPYIPSARIPTLDSSVKDFEPMLALDGGKDGFELYRKLFQEIREKKWSPKLVVCEIDHTHETIAQNEAKEYFPDYIVEVKKDLAKNTRILKITAEETQPQ